MEQVAARYVADPTKNSCDLRDIGSMIAAPSIGGIHEGASCRQSSRRLLFVEDLDDDFVCAVCQDVLEHPVRGPCQHEVCRACFEAPTEFRCPGCVDSIPWPVEGVVDAGKTWRMLLRQHCRCPNAGCDWHGSFSDLTAHRSMRCACEPLQCRHPGCPTQVPRALLPSHSAACDFRTGQCDSCLKLFRHINLPLHREVCLIVPISCPQKCGVSLPRGDVPNHIAEECPATVISCPLRSLGCDVRCRRDLMAQHSSSNAMSHLEIVCGEVRRLKEDHSRVLQEVREAHEARVAQAPHALAINGETLSTVVARLAAEAANHRELFDRFSKGLVIIVDASGCGQFRTITEALLRCTEGDTIIVRKGTYEEPQGILWSAITTGGREAPRPARVWIRGAGVHDVEIRLPASASGAVMEVNPPADDAEEPASEAAWFTLSDVTLVTSTRDTPAVRFRVPLSHPISTSERATKPHRSHLIHVKNVVVRSAVSTAVQVSAAREASAPARGWDDAAGSQRPSIVFTSCTFIAGSSGAALDLRGPTHVQMTNCATEGGASGCGAVVVSRAGNLAASGLQVVRCNGAGVTVKDANSLAVLTGCTLLRTGRNGVDVVGSARCVVSCSEIGLSERCGVCVTGGSVDVREHSKIHSCALPNVAVLAGGTVRIAGGCQVITGLTQGVAVKSGGSCTLAVDSVVSGNLSANIVCEVGGSLSQAALVSVPSP